MSSVVRKTITITEKQDQWIKSELSNGGYANENEYFQALLLQARKRQKSFNNLSQSLRDEFND